MDEDRSLHFIEMNTRIQVEHPVTEFITGVDLVKAQIRIAAGEKLATCSPGPVIIAVMQLSVVLTQSIPKNSLPPPAKITAFNLPGGTGVRVDTAQYAEGVVPPYYDSLIAKLIIHGKDRPEAISRMSRALEMFIVEGIHTSIPLHRKILADPEFRAGKTDTNFIERFFARNAEKEKAS